MIKNSKALFFIICVFTLSKLNAQVAGKVLSEEGVPIEWVTVFTSSSQENSVNTNRKGVFSVFNTEGKAQMKLKFSIIGYKTLDTTISVESLKKDDTLKITLEVNPISLDEVDANKNTQQIANEIMSNAIEKATYHTLNYKTYTLKSYIKTTIIVEELPFLTKFIDIPIKEGESFTIESINKIEFTQPNTYNEHILKYNSSVPIDKKENYIPQRIAKFDIYNPDKSFVTSPLAPNAFSNYEFDFEGGFYDEGTFVNKIKVIPKRKEHTKCEGYIYIRDGTWDIYSVDFSTTVELGTVKFFQQFAKYDHNIWMPKWLKANFEVKKMGFKGSGVYYNSALSYKITPNEKLIFIAKKNSSIVNEKANLKKINILSKKTKDSILKSRDNSSITSVKNYSSDSIVSINDSIFWQKVRPVPLSIIEKKGLVHMDTTVAFFKSFKKNDKDTSIVDFLIGKKYDLNDKSKIGLKYTLSLDPVNSLKFGMGMYYETRNEPNSFISNYKIRGHLYKLSHRKGNLFFLEYNTRFRNQTELKIDIGDDIININPNLTNKNISNVTNSLLNLFAQRNFLRFVKKKHAYFNFTYPNKSELNWNFDFSFLFNEYTQMNNVLTVDDFPEWLRNNKVNNFNPNIPNNHFIEKDNSLLHSQNSSIIKVDLELKPWQTLYIRNGTTRTNNRDRPVIKTTLKYAVPGLFDSKADFLYLAVDWTQKTNLFYNINYTYQIDFGLNLYNNNKSYYDFTFLNSSIFQSIFSNTTQMIFYTIPYYSFSTPDSYFILNQRFVFENLFITQIDFFSQYGKEAIGINFVNQLELQPYYEFNYSYTRIYKIFTVGIAMGTNDFKQINYRPYVGMIINL